MKGKAAESFEELHIYQRARELTNAVYALSREGAFAHDFGLVDQMRRASVSIMSNVAEGFERGTSTEFVQFLYIAKGSCGEVRAQLQVVADQNYIAHEEHARLTDNCRCLSSMISNFIAHLQSSGYVGEKATRLKRLAIEAQRRDQEALQAAQRVNIQSIERKNQQETP